MDNKVFFQHPDLMRALCLHETVMQLMVNTLNKAQQQQSATGGDLNTGNQRRHSTVPANIDNSIAEPNKVFACLINAYMYTCSYLQTHTHEPVS